MKEYQHEKPVISIHIPKCGGTSFRNVLEQWYGSKLYFHYLYEEKGTLPEKVRLKKFFLNTFKKDLCIHGHFNKNRGFGINAYYPEVDQFFTFLRDPLEMQISYFFHHHKMKDNNTLYKDGKKLDSFTEDLDQFLEESTSYTLLHFPDGITEENYKEFINEKFIHIGIMEDYQKSLDTLAQKLGKKNSVIDHINESKRTQTPSDSSVKKFLDKCVLEHKIYQYAVELNK